VDEQFADDNTPEADAELLKQERFIALRRAFAQLPERCRRILAMLFADPQLSYRQISGTLDIPVGGIGPTRKRCIAALRHDPAMALFIDRPEG
jgi:RNA polymerase sigma factor (sigma-70 family)